MRYRAVLGAFLFMLWWPAFSLDWSSQVSVGGGAALSFGAGLDERAADLSAAVGAEAGPAPVAAAWAGLSESLTLFGPVRLSAGLSAQRLGYALWAPDVSAYSYTALWAASLALGLHYEAGWWRIGAGCLASAPISDIVVSNHVPGLSIQVPSAVDAGKAYALGFYARCGIAPWAWRSDGPVRWRPTVEARLEAWPLGFVDGVDAWQLSATALVGMDLKIGGAR